jgi:transcriptional regulator with XRE-family HTH domain
MSREMNLANGGNVIDTLNGIRLYRGLYSRVARNLGVDPSYVSRVARGERRSKSIEAALGAEIRRLEKRIRPHSNTRYHS